MSDEKKVVNVQVIGFAQSLTIMFIALKLTHYIDWSWWWVFAPLWLPFAFLVGVLAFVFLVSMIGIGCAALLEKVAK